MQKRTLKVAILAALTIVLVFSMGAAALGQTSQFTDLNASITGQYDITLEQVSAISDVQGGLFRPYADITRAEYAVMAVNAFDIPLVNPATPSFPDVPKTHPQYMYIEAAYAAGVVMGYTDGTFGPGNTATRQQQLSMISRYVGGKAGYYSAGVWNWRTADEINALVAHFGDAASIDPAHKTAVAFAYAMGITKGNNFGNLAPVANVIRIQSAAMLIRSQALVPWATAYPAEVMLVSADKSENLIGKTHTLKFKVLDAGGHPAKGALVDFDTLYANPYYVGNISPQAAVTDAFGEVSVNLLSAEPGTQRVSATINTINGPATTMATKYWLAMDEIYILDEERWAENNAGTAHEWCARVVVIGPGPRSTSQFDWYNVIDASFDPADLQTDDGVWKSIDNYGEELDMLAADESMRTMAGIGVEWTVDWTDLADPSKGVIVAKDDLTDADGIACITINSTSIGEATVQAMAWYPENPYPQMLLDRDTADASDWVADDDWEQQPKAVASATKLWIPHIIGGDSDAPITPTYAVNNTGEVEEFVLELKDVYGNPIEDYQVEWWIQGVGFFKTDESTWVGVGEQNKDIDETDADGMASVLVKSEDAGQTIVHCKVMDKYGLPWKEWNVVKQWYAVDFVTMDNPLTTADESVATNSVGTSHTFDVWALGWKYVYVLTDVNHNGLRDDAVLLGDRADIKALSGDVLNFDGVTVAYTKGVGEVLPAGRVIRIGTGDRFTLYTNYTDASAIEEAIAWVDSIGDGVKEAWHPLQGKGVNFFTNVGMGGTPVSDTALATVVPGAPDKPYYVGSITGAAAPYPEWTYGGKLYDYDAVTDAGGKASVTITSTAKGSQWVYAVVDYPQNPQGGDPTMPTKWAELNWDSAVKTWTAGAGTTIRVFNAAGDPGNEFTNPILPYVRLGIDDITTPPNGESRAQLQPMVYGMFRGMDFDNPNREVIAVQIFDAYGNAVEGWKVDFQIVDQGKTLTTGKVPTYRPFTHFAEWPDAVDYDWVTPNWPGAGVGDLGPFVDTNPIWNALQDEHWYSDDDYSWGHTRNGEINYNETLDSAAYTTLILDQSIDELDEYAHVATKVNVKVWKPTTTGYVLVEDFQVEKTWEVPVPTTITLTPTADYAIAGVESQSVVATVLDQFGSPVVGALLDFWAFVLEGDGLTEDLAGDDYVTDEDGKVTFTWSEDSGDWGVQQIAAFWDLADDDVWDSDELTSNLSTIQWIYDDRDGGIGLDLVSAFSGEQKVYVWGSNPLWPGFSLTTHLNPGAAAIGGPVAYTGVDTSMSTGAKTWIDGEPFFVMSNSNNTDGVPNWVYDIVNYDD